MISELVVLIASLAVMTAAMGTCEALKLNAQEPDIPIETHMQGLDLVNFFGLSGYVEFEDGIRVDDGLYFTTLNLLPPGKTFANSTEPVLAEITAFYLLHGEFVELAPNYFADGRDVPPDLLRDLPEQNYLGWIRNVGFVLVGIGLSLALAAALWTFTMRKHKVLRASQPEFLYLLCFGSCLLTCAIIPLSFDESTSSTQFLNGACIAVPWLFAAGYIVVYSALFMKLWRVDRVLAFARRRVEIKHVAWPFVLLLLSGVAVLTAWTAIDPLQWERKELDSETGESIGRCNSHDMAGFLVPLVIVMLVPAGLTLFMSWKTRDVDKTYSEAFWIMFMVIVQLEVIVISLPMVGILRNVSSQGRYLGFSFLIWIVPVSTIGLIFGPKVRAVRQGERTMSARGASTGTVKVTGINEVTNGALNKEAVSTLKLTSVVRDPSVGHPTSLISGASDNEMSGISPSDEATKIVEEGKSNV